MNYIKYYITRIFIWLFSPKEPEPIEALLFTKTLTELGINFTTGIGVAERIVVTIYGKDLHKSACIEFHFKANGRFMGQY